MIQKIFHITWTILAIVLILAAGITTYTFIQINNTVNDIQKIAHELTHNDIDRILDILEQQVENDRIRAEYSSHFILNKPLPYGAEYSEDYYENYIHQWDGYYDANNTGNITLKPSEPMEID